MPYSSYTTLPPTNNTNNNNNNSNDNSSNGFDASGFTYGVAFVVGLIFLLFAIAFACMRLRLTESPNIHNILSGFPPSQVEHYIAEAMEEGLGNHHHHAHIDTSFQSYPKFLYSEENKKKSGSSGISSVCSICLGDYKESDMLRMLPDCGHVYHQACVDPWLMLHSTCPVCRKSSVQASQSSASNVGE